MRTMYALMQSHSQLCYKDGAGFHVVHALCEQLCLHMQIIMWYAQTCIMQSQYQLHLNSLYLRIAMAYEAHLRLNL